MALEAGAAFALSAVLLQGLSASSVDSNVANPGAGRVLLADLKVIPQTAPAENPTRPSDQKPAVPLVDKAADAPAGTGKRTQDAGPGNVPRETTPRSAAKPVRGDAVAKCYDELLDFSLGDSDAKTNERIKNQDCSK